MKRYLFAVCLSLFSAVCVCAQDAKLYVEKDTVNLGVISKDVRRLTAGLPVYNYGEAPLTIYKAKTDCSCTLVEVDRTPIPSAEYKRLMVNINIDRIIPGEFYKSIMIYSSDVEPKKVTFKYTVDMSL